MNQNANLSLRQLISEYGITRYEEGMLVERVTRSHDSIVQVALLEVTAKANDLLDEINWRFSGVRRC